MSAVCGVCGQACRYANIGRGYVWVHTDTGRWASNEPTAHDCNTTIIRGDEPAGPPR